MSTLNEIEGTAISARNPDWDAYLNCGAINTHIRDALRQNLGVSAVLIEDGVIRYSKRSNAGSEHAFVVVHRNDVDDSQSHVIIDGALQQFSEEMKEKGQVSTAVAPEDEIPLVVVLTPGHEWYDSYGRWKTEFDEKIASL